MYGRSWGQQRRLLLGPPTRGFLGLDGLRRPKRGLRPTLTQRGTNANSANVTGPTTIDFTFTSLTGNILVAVGYRNNGSNTALPSMTFDSVAVPNRCGQILSGTSSGGSAIHTLRGATKGSSATLAITPPSSIGRAVVAFYDVDEDWDGTLTAITANTDANADADLTLSVGSPAANTSVLVIGGFVQTSSAPITVTGAMNKLDERTASGGSTGAALCTALAELEVATTIGTITFGMNASIANKVACGIVLSNAS